MKFVEALIFDQIDLSKKLDQGSAALFPTDTLPALAAAPCHANQLWKIKNRKTDKPFILMGSSQEELFVHVESVALDDARLIAQKFWPGALTLVLPSKGNVVNALNPKGSMLGMRVPDCKYAKNLLARTGPLATTSANLAGEVSSLSAEEAAKCFPGLPLLGPVPWPIPSGVASTVLAWQGLGDWRVLRRGAVIPSVSKE